MSLNEILAKVSNFKSLNEIWNILKNLIIQRRYSSLNFWYQMWWYVMMLCVFIWTNEGSLSEFWLQPKPAENIFVRSNVKSCRVEMKTFLVPRMCVTSQQTMKWILVDLMLTQNYSDDCFMNHSTFHSSTFLITDQSYKGNEFALLQIFQKLLKIVPHRSESIFFNLDRKIRWNLG